MGITTEKQIKSLVPSDKKQSFGCGDGLRLKVESIKRHGGKYFEGEVNRQYIHLGSYGIGVKKYSLKEAKNEWSRIKEWSIKNEKHPKFYKEKEQGKNVYSFGDAVNLFLREKEKTTKQTTYKDYKNKCHFQLLALIDKDSSLRGLEWESGGRIKIKKVLETIADGSKYELQRRCQNILKQVFDYAIDEGWMPRGQNPAQRDKKGSFIHKTNHHKSIKWDQVPSLLHAINLNKCNTERNTILCTKLMLMTSLRAGAVSRLEWEWIKEINGVKCFVIPATTSGLKRRKGKSDDKDHHVPITPEILKLLELCKELNGNKKYVFPAWRTRKYPHINPEAPNKFLQNIGFRDVLVAHGWRSVFTTAGKEQLKVPLEIIKLQMGHLPKGKVDKAYDQSLMIDERKDLLEKWCNALSEKGLEI